MFMRIAPNLLLIFYIGKGIFLETKNRRSVSTIICICALLVACIAVLELYFNKNIIYDRYIRSPYYTHEIFWAHRPVSTQFHPAILGTYFLCAIPFALALTRERSVSIKVLGWSVFALCSTLTFLARSRGAFVGLIALFLFYAWNKGYKKIFFSVISLVILVGALGSFQSDATLGKFGFSRLISGSHDSAISPYRLDRIKMSLKIVKEYPVFGIGYNHFRLRFNEYCAPESRNTIFMLKIPDNMYLSFLAETGIVGLSGFLIFSIVIFMRGARALKSKTGIQREWILIPFTAYVAVLVQMWAYEFFYWSSPSMFFFLLCGFIQAAALSVE
ncbi:MAG: O-antigen ligase family protein [Candidatus Omnitrophota bacterium]